MIPITAVLCGAGNRGLDGYGKLALAMPERLCFVAVAEPIEARRLLAQERHHIPESQCFKDWQELDRVDKRIADVAIVATPDGGHVEPTLALMRKGYHVLLEKPMALSAEDCGRLIQCKEETGRILNVCHVLRYAPYFREMKSFLESGCLGQLLNIQHLEPVNFWRFAHSFVRGNWSVEEESSPFILSKCCHDFDLLSYLVDAPCRKVSSFGSLGHFRPENKPEGAASNCLDCALESCPYSAKRYYLDLLNRGETDWPVNVLVHEFTEEALLSALRMGPYGRCVYECANNVVDHQVVILEFAGGITATFTAAAFTDHRVRETELMGSLGSLKGNGSRFEFSDFRTRRVETWEVKSEGRHLGGDIAMIESFLRAVETGDQSLLDTGPQESVASHLMAFAAERSRLTGEVQLL